MNFISFALPSGWYFVKHGITCSIEDETTGSKPVYCLLLIQRFSEVAIQAVVQICTFRTENKILPAWQSYC